MGFRKEQGVLGNIQILRFAAALLVVLFHVAWTAQNEGNPTRFLAGFIKWGEAGVDIFFVISGFVMVLSQARSPRRVDQFLIERALRIVPMYWILTLLSTALLLLLPGLFSSSSFSVQKTLTSLFFVNSWLGQGYPVLYVGWTLEYEWLFYLIISLSFMLFPIGFTWIAVLAVFLALNWAGPVELVSLEFVYGMVIGLLYLRGKRLPKPALFVAGGVLLLAAFAQLPAGQLPRQISYGVPALLIVAALVCLPQVKGKAALFLGAASYDIYLIQVFTIPVVFRLIGKLFVLPSDLTALLAAAVTLVAGGLACALVEKPLTNRMKDWLRASPRLDIGARSRPVR
nr:acyltransferase [Paracoccus aestuariivivens]